MTSRTRERLKDTGEIFTPPSLVCDVLTELNSGVWQDNSTFLDTAAGDGNLIITVLAWKLAEGHHPTQALGSVFAVEFMEDNATRLRQRLLNLVGDTPEHRAITENNIVWADTLTYDLSFCPDDNRALTDRRRA